ncbi:amyloid-beta A4 precursor protein-binding family A member 3 isoform X2 [Carettochelys insculpta]|uniref:amyloid-beta A4 precursor protein-binding family A member 3 isoform X2 n=1 Tax=Carettochelys insculpta TaxID=44489 RepID=UPI003EBF9747
MDYQPEACPGPGFGSHSPVKELLESPAMDLEEGILPALVKPVASEESLQQPGSPFSALYSDLHASAPEAKLLLSAAASEPTVSSSAQGGLPIPGPPAARGLAAEEARADACSDPGTEGGWEEAAAPGSDPDWKRKPGGAQLDVGYARALASKEQCDLVRMDLDAEPEALLSWEEWAETEGEDDKPEIHGLLARLQALSSSCHDDSPASEQDPLLASDCGTGPYGGEVPLPHKRLSGCCRGLPGECPPCPLHVATGRGLAVPPCRAQCSAGSRRSRESHGLLSAEAGREDLLSLLHHEGGLPVEAGEETPLARLDILARSDREALQLPESPAAQRVEEATSQAGSPRARGSCRRYRKGGARKEDAACMSPGSRDSSPEAAWVSAHSSQGPERAPHGSAAKESLAAYPAFKEVAGPCEPEDLLDGVIFGAKYLGSTQLVSERNPPPSVRMAQAQEAVDRIKAPDGESQPMTEVDLFVSTQRIKVLTADSQEAMMDHPLQTISYIADIGSIVVLMARRKLPRRTDSPGEKRLYKMICHVFHSADAQLIAQAIGQAFSAAYQQLLQASGIDPSQLCPSQEGHALESQELHNGDLAHFSNQDNCKEDLRWQTEVTLSIVRCPPVTTAIIRRPDSQYPLGFCVEDGIICSLMRGGIAERGGIRVGHRIVEINGQSVVATPHEKIIRVLTQAVREVVIKTMPASTYRLLTGQEQPLFL